MKQALINEVLDGMLPHLDNVQLKQLEQVMTHALFGYEVQAGANPSSDDSDELIAKFLAAKRIEGCSENTLSYYFNTIRAMLDTTATSVRRINTDQLRDYLTGYQQQRGSSKTTIDNIRRILSSLFSWLEDEDYIVKSPVRRIHKVKAESRIKEIYSDEQLELMRDNSPHLRDLAMIDLLASSGMRVGELVRLNRSDVDFHNRECKVVGKGDKQRVVYFDARAKLHLHQYLRQRADDEAALFVGLSAPHARLTIGAVEARLRKLGRALGIGKVHPHKFRRTLATSAIDKGMPIEQLQCLLGHKRIDTTLHYAMVKQNNVKLAHRKYIG